MIESYHRDKGNSAGLDFDGLIRCLSQKNGSKKTVPKTRFYVVTFLIESYHRDKGDPVVTFLIESYHRVWVCGNFFEWFGRRI